MASPFRIFRKYQKTLLAIAGVVLMFVFVIGDSLVSYLTGAKNARAGDERDARSVAVHWDGGSLTNRQLNELVSRRRLLNAFLNQVQGEGERSSAMAGVDPPPLRVQRLVGPETPQQGVERDVVRAKLFADAAREAGMSVSDDIVRQYLDDLGRRNVSRERMREILSGMQVGNGRASIDYVIDGLRDEMLANNYLISQQFAIRTVTPQQQWKDWLLVNDRVVIEAAAVPAESFLAEVKKPTEAELQTLFDQYKDREASPEIAYGTTELPSAIPGFKIPRKVDLQFIEASYDDFLTKAEAKVTEPEIAKYYDEHKKLFEKADTGLMEDASKKKDNQKPAPPATKGDTKQGAEQAKPNDAQKKAVEPDGKKTSNAKGEKQSSPPANAEKSKETTSPDKKSAGQPPTDSKDQPAKKDDKTEPAPAKEKQSSHRANSRVFRLAAFEEKAEKKNADADKSGAGAESKSATPTSPQEKASSPAPSDSKTTDAAKPPATGPAAAPPKTDQGSSAAAKPAGPVLPPAAPPAAPGAAADVSKNAPAAPAKPEKPVQYQSLSEVKDLIRRQIAEGKVAEQLTQLTGELYGHLDGDYSKWFNEALAAQADKQPAPAPPQTLIDLAPIAQKSGLKQVRTGPKSYLELRSMPIGKTAVPDSGRGLLSLLFSGKELDLYQPVSTVDIDGNRFVAMKMSDTPARVPTLAEVRNEVIRVWKNQKAAELAQKHAEELAKKAQDSKATLTDFFADNKSMKVVRTDPFSELTGGEVGLVNGQYQPQPFRLSQPDGVVAPGPGFMKRVFELKDGEVGVALNHDHSIAYIIRVVEHQPGLNELRTAYLAEANTWPGQYGMMQEHVQEAANSVARDIITAANVKWDRVADKSTHDEQNDAG